MSATYAMCPSHDLHIHPPSKVMGHKLSPTSSSRATKAPSTWSIVKPEGKLNLSPNKRRRTASEIRSVGIVPADTRLLMRVCCSGSGTGSDIVGRTNRCE
jgi:hypothetical protein